MKSIQALDLWRRFDAGDHSVTGMDFPTKEALRKYLEEHPGADRSKHHVQAPEGKHRPSDADNESEVRTFKKNFETTVKKVRGKDQKRLKSLVEKLESGGDALHDADEELVKWHREMMKPGRRTEAEQDLVDALGEAMMLGKSHLRHQYWKTVNDPENQSRGRARIPLR